MRRSASGNRSGQAERSKTRRLPRGSPQTSRCVKLDPWQTLAGHAATFLLNHSLGILEEVGPLLTIGPTVDTLAVFSDSSIDLLHHWQQAVEMAGDPYRLLDDIAHHTEPESVLVLEALGNALPDKRLAKTARKELFKLRGRMSRT